MTKRCVAIYEDMEGDGWMQIVNSFYMKFAVFSFLQITNLTFDNWYYSLSSILAIISAAYCAWYPIRIALIIRRGNLKSKAYYKRYGGIWDEYKEDRYHTASFEVVVCLKKLMIAVALVFLGSNSELQIFTLVVTMCVYYAILYCWKPYKLENANIYFLKAELMFIFGLIAVLYLSYKKMAMEANLYTKLGWCVTYCFAFGWIRMI